MLFNIKPVKSTEEVQNEVKKIVARQKPGSMDDLTPFDGEIETLLKQLVFKPSWKKLPVVARVAIIEFGDKTEPFTEDIVLPNTKHDLELVLKMLNYMREQKKLNKVNMPLFIQPDEISLASAEGKTTYDGGKIKSQLALVLQKGAVMYAGFVFGKDYAILVG